MYRGEKISLENRALLLAIFCLLFFVISGVSASDVVDMSNNPDNNNIVSDSNDPVSQESVGNYYTNQLSNEDDSSLSSQDANAKVVETSIGESELKSSSTVESSSILSAKALSTSSDSKANVSSSSSSSSLNSKESAITGEDNKTAPKTSTKLKLTKSKIYSGTPIVITLKDKDGKVLSGKKVIIRVPSKKRTFTKTTDSKGQVKLNYHKIGTFKTYISFKGDTFYKASKISAKIKVLKSGTSLKVTNTTVPRSTAFIVTLTNKKSGLGIKNKTVIFKIPKWNNRVYKRTTNSKGQAKLVVTAKKKFSVKIRFAGTKNLYKSKLSTKVKPIKCKTKFVYSNPKTMEFGSDFVITLKKVNNEAVKNKKVKIKITNKGKTYTKTTNSKGQFTVPISDLGELDAKISFAGDSIFIKTSTSTSFNVVKGATEIKGSDNGVGQGSYFYATLKNSAGKALANKKVVVTFNGKKYYKTTNSAGKVSLLMDYKKGSYPMVVSYSGSKYYNSSKWSGTVKVVDPSISISKIITAAKDLKTRVEYINLLNKSYTVTIDNKRYTMDEFAYLMAGAITNLKSGSKADVKIKDLSNNYKSNGAKIKGKLSKTEYLKLAKQVTQFVDSKKRIPNYKSTSLGKMEANLYIYAFTKVLCSYKSNKKLPASVTVKTKDVRGGYSYSISQGGKILNCREIFDSASFAKYLKTSGKSAVNAAIRNKAKSLTKGLTNPLAKAIAIFRFVRDDIKYSFYTNSLKGSTGTYSSRSGNCCDKANLIVAMCRSVGVYARYSHAQGCRFQSGLYTGHVWAQVYDTNTQTWYTADATSFRNEVGRIKNWNTASHYRDKNYVLIPF